MLFWVEKQKMFSYNFIRFSSWHAVLQHLPAALLSAGKGNYLLRAHLASRKGFTLVELVVILAILAVLGSLAGAGMAGWLRLARFRRNESAAGTLYQAAQLALTRLSTEGTLDDFLCQAGALGQPGGEGLERSEQERTMERAGRVLVLYLDRADPEGEAGPLLRELLTPCLRDTSLLEGSLALELDMANGRVVSVFYAAGADRLRFGGGSGAVDIGDRSMSHRRESLVGYFTVGELLPVVPPELLAPSIPVEGGGAYDPSV